MAGQESFAAVEFIVDGERFTGWSDDDPPLEWEFDDAIDYKTGADGGLYVKGMPNFGGGCTFKVMPNSPTAQWSMQREQMRKDNLRQGNPIRPFAGTYYNPVTRTNYRMEGGYIQMFPAVATPGVTYEGQIRWENIVSLVDGGIFTPPLTSAP